MLVPLSTRDISDGDSGAIPIRAAHQLHSALVTAGPSI